MDPLENVFMIPSNTTVAQVHHLLLPNMAYVPLYHKEHSNIVGIAFVRDLIKAPFGKRVRDYSRSPWFITESTPLIQIMKQFRRNNENVAIVLDAKGQSKGILSLENIIEEIFGKRTHPYNLAQQGIMIDRTLPGSMTIEEFNREFSANLSPDGASTLAEMLQALLEHTPEKGESVWIPPYEFTIKETSLLEIKTISVKTKIS